MSVYRILALIIFSTLSSLVYSQEQLSVSGSLDNNTYFYIYDDKIVPPGIPQYERFQLMDHLAPFIDAGKVKVFSIDSINNDSWMNKQLDPRYQSVRQQQRIWQK